MTWMMTLSSVFAAFETVLCHVEDVVSGSDCVAIQSVPLLPPPAHAELARWRAGVFCPRAPLTAARGPIAWLFFVLILLSPASEGKFSRKWFWVFLCWTLLGFFFAFFPLGLKILALERRVHRGSSSPACPPCYIER